MFTYCKIILLINIIYLTVIYGKLNSENSDDNLDSGDNGSGDNGSGDRKDTYTQDLSDAFKIDASTEGLQKVHLKCGADSMQLELETEEDFNGVMYTRGSFYKQQEPCFVRPNIKKGSRALAMKFTLSQCHTLHNHDVYSNVVVIQHDPDLVTPGDAAFSVECDFRKPRSLTVEANLQARDSDERIAYGSRITLTSPDPSQSSNKLDENGNQSIFNDSSSVTFIPSARKIRGTVENVRLNDEL